MPVKAEAQVSQIRDKDEQLFLNLDNGWGKVVVHTYTHNCIAAVLRDGNNVTFGVFASRENLCDYAHLTGANIEWSQGD